MPEASGGPGTWLGTVFILVTDFLCDFRFRDDSHIRSLKQHGYSVISAVDGADAIDAFVRRASEVQLLVSDLDMPKVGGYELALALREMKPKLSIIVMSGAIEKDEERLKKFSAAFLPKPFVAQTLLEIVRRTLDRSNSAAPFLPKT